jgi:serine protease AprX
MKTSSSFKRFISLTLVLVVFVALLGPAVTSAPAAGMQSYIIQGVDVEQVVRLVEKHGGEVTSRLDVIRGVGAVLPLSAVAALQAEAGITSVFPNADVRLADVVSKGANDIPSTDYPEVVGADLVWQEGNLGNGVTVAVVDTGLGWHPGLFLDAKGRVRDRVVGWVDFVDGKKLPRDPNGHGTHVAGIIANSQKDAAGEYDGVAPDVNLVGVRVLDEKGGSTYERVIKGIQWVIDHKDKYNIGVMNLSLVSAAQSPYWADPLNQAVMQAWADGIVVVTAAGNAGPAPMTVGVPGNTPYVITVGAFTDNYTPMDWSDDYITPFSAAGPTMDAFVKPDVVAPGAHMVSTIMPGAKLTREYPNNKVNPFYFEMAGTSQATAVVSGIAALVLAQNPDLTPDEVKYRIMGTSFLWVDLATNEALYSMWQQGAGRANAYDAVMVDVEGAANQGMDILADLAGDHYQGHTIYDEATGTFQIDGLGAWAGKYGAWAGGYGAWAGGYGAWAGGLGAWAGGYGAWAGGYGAWAGGLGAWAGGLGAWAGGLGAWAGGMGAWAGGYGGWAGGYGGWAGGMGAWAGGMGAWAGSVPWAGTYMAEIEFVENFMDGVSPDANSASATIEWVEEP